METFIDSSVVINTKELMTAYGLEKTLVVTTGHKMVATKKKGVTA